MFEALHKIYRHDGLRVTTVTMFFMGVAMATTVPYLSIIGINELGLSTQIFGALLLLTAVISTVSAVIIGHFSDQAANRKTAIMVSFIIGAIGAGQLAVFPSQITFVLFLLVFSPLVGASFSQLFAVVRTIAQQWGNDEAASINTGVRATLAASWVVVPGLAGLFIAWTGRATDAFGISAVVYLFCVFYYAFLGPDGGGRQANTQAPLQGLLGAFKLIGSSAIFSRVVSIAVIGVTHPVNAAVMPLIILSLDGGSVRDVGLIAGIVAGLEIPFMLLAGAMVKRFSLLKVIAVGGICHAIYLIALASAPSVGTIYALCLINAAGAAVLLTLHLNYLQDTMPDRPGLGTSLMSIQGMIQRGLSAGVVAGIGLLFGFTGALVISAVACLLGIGMLFWVDNRLRVE